jgi:hypothetical protein
MDAAEEFRSEIDSGEMEDFRLSEISLSLPGLGKPEITSRQKDDAIESLQDTVDCVCCTGSCSRG